LPSVGDLCILSICAHLAYSSKPLLLDYLPPSTCYPVSGIVSSCQGPLAFLYISVWQSSQQLVPLVCWSSNVWRGDEIVHEKLVTYPFTQISVCHMCSHHCFMLHSACSLPHISLSLIHNQVSCSVSNWCNIILVKQIFCVQA
jgi:hypothetical protein